jgi:hypothetical protein
MYLPLKNNKRASSGAFRDTKLKINNDNMPIIERQPEHDLRIISRRHLHHADKASSPVSMYRH